MEKYKLYVGSNNETKILELELIKGVLNTFFEGYSLSIISGVWKGLSEQTAIIEILSENIDDKIKIVASQLKELLHQEAILISKEPIISAEFI